MSNHRLRSEGTQPGTLASQEKGIEWSLRAERLFLRARAFDKQLQKFCEHEQANTHLILRAIRATAKFCEHF